MNKAQLKHHNKLLDLVDELHIKYLQGVPMYKSFEDSHTDLKYYDLEIAEGLNINTTFEYIEVTKGVYIIDMGILSNERLIYLVSIQNNELIFKYIDPPIEFKERLREDGFDLKSFKDIAEHITNLKGADAINSISDVELQNLNFGKDKVKRLFNTIYKITLEFCKNNVYLVYFRANINEASRVSLYNYIYDSLSREDFIDGLGDFVVDEYELLDESVQVALEEVGFEKKNNYKTYVMGVYL